VDRRGITKHDGISSAETKHVERRDWDHVFPATEWNIIEEKRDYTHDFAKEKNAVKTYLYIPYIPRLYI